MNTSTKFSASQKGLAPILIVILIALGIGGYFLYQKQNKSMPQSVPSSAIIPVPTSAGETTNWGTYKKDEWKIEFKYPEKTEIEDRETSLLIAGNKRSNGMIIVSDKDKSYVVLSKLKLCKEVDAEIKKNSSADRSMCLDSGNKFGQSKDIDIVDLNGTSVRSFYETSYGIGETYHVLQTIQQPFIQLISFYPNETLFNQILSTFKFIN